MSRKVLLSLGLILLAGASLASWESDDVSSAARKAWARAQSTGGDLRALGDPIAASGVLVTNTANTPVVGLLGLPDLTGVITWGNSTGIATEAGIKGLAGISPAGAGFLAVRSSTGTTAWLVEGNSGLQTAAGDLAETFPSTVGGVEPGTVVVIDPARPGAVQPSSRAYDRLVAGVVAGAQNQPSAITLKALGTVGDRVPVALAGTVHCRVVGPVRPGDLLTTSAVPGRAMAAVDPMASRGAVLGKALQGLDGPRGTVLVLVSLQ